MHFDCTCTLFNMFFTWNVFWCSRPGFHLSHSISLGQSNFSRIFRKSRSFFTLLRLNFGTNSVIFAPAHSKERGVQADKGFCVQIQPRLQACHFLGVSDSRGWLTAGHWYPSLDEKLLDEKSCVRPGPGLKLPPAELLYSVSAISTRSSQAIIF